MITPVSPLRTKAVKSVLKFQTPAPEQFGSKNQKKNIELFV